LMMRLAKRYRVVVASFGAAVPVMDAMMRI